MLFDFLTPKDAYSRYNVYQPGAGGSSFRPDTKYPNHKIAMYEIDEGFYLEAIRVDGSFMIAHFVIPEEILQTPRLFAINIEYRSNCDFGMSFYGNSGKASHYALRFNQTSEFRRVSCKLKQMTAELASSITLNNSDIKKGDWIIFKKIEILTIKP